MGVLNIRGEGILKPSMFWGFFSFDRAMLNCPTNQRFIPNKWLVSWRQRKLKPLDVGIPDYAKTKPLLTFVLAFVFVETWLMLAGLGYHSGNSIGNGVKLCVAGT